MAGKKKKDNLQAKTHVSVLRITILADEAALESYAVIFRPALSL